MIKPPPDRLYGRIRGHALRPRQQRLIAETLPRLLFQPDACPAAWFGAPMREVWLEVGFGGGEHALAQAETHPEIGLIACEVFENGICSLLTRLVADGEEAEGALPANLRLWPDDARVLLRGLPDHSISTLFVLFPDPWPKARHAKRRLVHPALLPEAARILRPGGEWRIASDEPTYQRWVEDVFRQQTLFELVSVVPDRPAAWPPTRYEQKARRAGRDIRYWTFRKP
jgi:tRNA (guanine-N7-)-methyltransferase